MSVSVQPPDGGLFVVCRNLEHLGGNITALEERIALDYSHDLHGYRGEPLSLPEHSGFLREDAVHELSHRRGTSRSVGRRGY